MKTIICFGDSNTYGFDPKTGLRFPPDVRWTGRLQLSLGEKARIIEEGCNGRTALGIDPIEGWKNAKHYLKPMLNSHKPVDLLIIMLGSNDLKKQFDFSAKEIANGIEELVKEAKAFTKEKQGFESQILLVSPITLGDMIDSPFAGGFDDKSIKESKRLAPLYEKIAREYGCLFLDASLVAHPSKEDSLHLDEEGHKAIADAIVKIIEKCES